MEREAARGEWPGGCRPHGCQLDRATGKLTLVEAEAALWFVRQTHQGPPWTPQ
jgi:hypothetical protein